MKKYLSPVIWVTGIAASFLMTAWSNHATSLTDSIGHCPSRVGSFDMRTYSNVVGLAVNESYLVTTGHYGLTVWDVRDANSPVPSASYVRNSGDSFQFFSKVELDPRGYAIVAHRLRSPEILIIELDTPEGPRAVRSINHRPEALAVGNEVLAISDGGRVTLFDFSDPRNPVERSVIYPQDYSASVFSLGFYEGRLIVIHNRGIEIYSLEDIDAPELISAVDQYIASPQDACIAGLNVVVGSYSGTTVFDLSKLEEPQVVDHDLPSIIIALAPVGTRVFASTTSQIVELDVSNPSAPTLVSQLEQSMTTRSMGARGNWLWMDAGVYGMLTLNTDNGLEISGGTELARYNYALAASGSVGMVALGYGGADIIDISDPDHPQVLVHHDEHLTSFENGLVFGSTLYAVVAKWVTGIGEVPYLYTFDLSNPADPVLTSTMPTDWIKTMHASENLLVVLDQTSTSDRVLFIDISDPLAPVVKSNRETERYAYGAVAIDDVVYVGTAYSDGFEIFDVKDVSNPEQLGKVHLENCPVECMDRVGNVVYALASEYFNSNELTSYVIDVSDPRSPTVLGGFPVSGYRMSAAGTTVAVDNGDGVSVVDLADPSEPVVRKYEALWYTRGLALAGTRALLLTEQYLETLSLECDPPEAEFSWYGSGPEFWFVDGCQGWVGEYRWDFGDGTTSNQRAPHHIYEKEGSYVVTLEVHGEGTNSVSKVVSSGPRLRRVRGAIQP